MTKVHKNTHVVSFWSPSSSAGGGMVSDKEQEMVKTVGIYSHFPSVICNSWFKGRAVSTLLNNGLVTANTHLQAQHTHTHFYTPAERDMK